MSKYEQTLCDINLIIKLNILEQRLHSKTNNNKHRRG